MRNDNALLIMGNGFDLQCGLKSSYKHFFEWLRLEYQKGSNGGDKQICNNIWVAHFLNIPITGEGWADVEDSLKNALIINNETSESPVEKWKRIINENLANSINNYINIDEELCCICRYNREEGCDSFLKYNNNLYWFLDRLIDFECIFSKYLCKQVSNNISYIKNVFKLISLIVDEEKFSVINFNYTNPFHETYLDSASLKLKELFLNATNVHGTLSDDNIIFGIDVTKEKELSLESRIFTKTHRKMLLKSPKSTLPQNITKIKFYGHSLGEADYSYFQSIFDNYNLYGDNLDTLNYYSNDKQVMLQFYFTILNEKNKKNEERSAIDRVYKLITGYGTTLDNKDKGNNLLHKLLLEGRVQIEFLSTI